MTIYKLIYLMAANQEEKLIQEFGQKLESQISELNGIVSSVRTIKQTMVKTTKNKGARGIHVVEVILKLDPDKLAELKQFLKLSKGSVLNHQILRESTRSTDQKRAA